MKSSWIDWVLISGSFYGVVSCGGRLFNWEFFRFCGVEVACSRSRPGLLPGHPSVVVDYAKHGLLDVYIHLDLTTSNLNFII